MGAGASGASVGLAFVFIVNFFDEELFLGSLILSYLIWAESVG